MLLETAQFKGNLWMVVLLPPVVERPLYVNSERIFREFKNEVLLKLQHSGGWLYSFSTLTFQS